MDAAPLSITQILSNIPMAKSQCYGRNPQAELQLWWQNIDLSKKWRPHEVVYICVQIQTIIVMIQYIPLKQDFAEWAILTRDWTVKYLLLSIFSNNIWCHQYSSHISLINMCHDNVSCIFIIKVTETVGVAPMSYQTNGSICFFDFQSHFHLHFHREWTFGFSISLCDIWLGS